MSTGTLILVEHSLFQHLVPTNALPLLVPQQHTPPTFWTRFAQSFCLSESQPGVALQGVLRNIAISSIQPLLPINTFTYLEGVLCIVFVPLVENNPFLHCKQCSQRGADSRHTACSCSSLPMLKADNDVHGVLPLVDDNLFLYHKECTSTLPLVHRTFFCSFSAPPSEESPYDMDEEACTKKVITAAREGTPQGCLTRTSATRIA